MASTLRTVQEAANGLIPGSTPEAVQALLDIATSYLVEVLSMRGQTIEEWRRYRKETVAAELAKIESELAEFESTPTNPLG